MSLHFHAGSKDNAEAIIDKLKASKELSSSTEVDVPERPRSSAAKSVHFDADPDIIPPRDDSEDGEEVEELEEPEPVHEPEELDLADGDAAVVLYDFTADGEDELSVKEGESLIVLERDGDDWWRIRNSDGLEGVVPASYMEVSYDGVDCSFTSLIDAVIESSCCISSRQCRGRSPEGGSGGGRSNRSPSSSRRS